MYLSQLQSEARRWRAHNFPGATAEQQFMGMVEEMGEIAHAVLKVQQGIRGMEAAAARDAIIDGIGDLIIFLTGFCDCFGIDLGAAVEETWDKVQQRDWIADPERGGQ